MKRRVSNPVVHAQNVQPLLGQLVLFVRHRLINADGVKIPGEDHVAYRGTDPVIQMQAAADVADMFFDIPDGFAAAATPTEQREVVAVALRMIAGDQAQQRGFPRAVGADNLPVLAWIDRPVEVIKDRAIVISDHPIAQHDARLVGIKRVARRRGVGFRKGNTVELFAVRELGNQRLLKQRGFFACLCQVTVGQDARVLDKVRNFIKTVKHQHEGISLLIKRRQQRRQLRPGLHVKTVERFVQNKQFRFAHQRLTKQRFSRLAGRKVFKAPVQQRGDTELFCQALAAGGILHFILNNFRRRTAGIVFARAEQIGVVALPLVADQLLQLFKRQARQARKVALVFALEEVELSGQRAGQRGFTAAVCANKRPAFTRA